MSAIDLEILMSYHYKSLNDVVKLSSNWIETCSCYCLKRRLSLINILLLRKAKFDLIKEMYMLEDELGMPHYKGKATDVVEVSDDDDDNPPNPKEKTLRAAKRRRAGLHSELRQIFTEVDQADRSLLKIIKSSDKLKHKTDELRNTILTDFAVCCENFQDDVFNLIKRRKIVS